MNDDTFEGKWKQLKGDVQVWFGKTFNEPQAELKGNHNKITGWLQEKKGLAQAEAEAESNKFNQALEDLQAKWESSKADAQAKWTEAEEEISSKVKAFMARFDKEE